MTEQIEDRPTESIDGEDGCIWAFRGYQLDPAHFTTAMIHFYRGELARSNVWRTRLDTMTNWAVVTVGAALTFVFGALQNPHFVLLLVFLLLLTFLYFEARRYWYYVLWAYRVHLMETDFFAAMLAPPFRPSPDWADHLVSSLLHPVFPIAWWEAIGRRFRRNYVWLITLLIISWMIKLTLHPTLISDWATIVERAAVGLIPGTYVMSAVGAVYGLLAVLAAADSFPSATWDDLPMLLRWLERRLRRTAGPRLSKPRRQERMATIVTTYGQEVAVRLLKELGRGVTASKGTGMYTGQARDVLLCAVTEVRVSSLEGIVLQVDPNAFVIISAADRVRGEGFRPFEAPS